MEKLLIKINNEDFVLKQSFRALLMFEEKAKKSSDKIEENLTDMMLLFYCLLSAGNLQTFKYTYDQFLDLIDNDQTLFEFFVDYLKEQAKNVEQQPNKKKIKK